MEIRPKNPNKNITKETISIIDIFFGRFSLLVLIAALAILIVTLILIYSQPKVVHNHRPDKVLIGVYQQNTERGVCHG